MHWKWIFGIIWFATSFTNWCATCGFFREYKNSKSISPKNLLLIIAVLCGPVASISLALGGVYRHWAWYPETERERISRETLEKLES